MPSADQVLIRAVRPQYERMEATTLRLIRRLKEPAAKVDAVVAELETSVLPTYRRLQVLLPSAQHHRTLNLRDDIGRIYNNAAIEILNRHSARDRRIVPLLEQAEAYAVGADLLVTIAANQNVIQSRTTYRPAQSRTTHRPPQARTTYRPAQRSVRREPTRYKFYDKNPDGAGGCIVFFLFLLCIFVICVLVQIFK